MISAETLSTASPADQRDAVLIERVAAGDRGASMEALCARYAGPLFALGMRTLGERGMAEEMVQDTFVKLWQSAGRYDAARGGVRSFIFGIARHACVDLLRRRASRPLSTQHDVGLLDADPATAIEEPVENVLREIALSEALDTLSEKHREALQLHFHQDLTQRQIAEQLGVPLGTVKTRTFHALRALRATLQERGIVP